MRQLAEIRFEGDFTDANSIIQDPIWGILVKRKASRYSRSESHQGYGYQSKLEHAVVKIVLGLTWALNCDSCVRL
ncbi:hypothetical protein Y032_0672g1380 [Ancylostoma ceylanicum]|uniref:Uncharacterized protein n=1 Tax=Ancylostoma ceylanicum TaxID=53326 RepID=A0A016WIR1_9BILA|nr:hypothetical protein Y032_0672g1380 [Ancylostoma ceylanicum]